MPAAGCQSEFVTCPQASINNSGRFRAGAVGSGEGLNNPAQLRSALTDLLLELSLQPQRSRVTAVSDGPHRAPGKCRLIDDPRSRIRSTIGLRRTAGIGVELADDGRYSSSGRPGDRCNPKSRIRPELPSVPGTLSHSHRARLAVQAKRYGTHSMGHMPLRPLLQRVAMRMITTGRRRPTMSAYRAGVIDGWMRQGTPFIALAMRKQSQCTIFASSSSLIPSMENGLGRQSNLISLSATCSRQDRMTAH